MYTRTEGEPANINLPWKAAWLGFEKILLVAPIVCSMRTLKITVRLDEIEIHHRYGDTYYLRRHAQGVFIPRMKDSLILNP